MIFDWETNTQQLPIDAGVGRVFKIGNMWPNEPLQSCTGRSVE